MNMAWEGLLVQWWLVSFEFVFLNRCCYIVLSYGLERTNCDTVFTCSLWLVFFRPFITVRSKNRSMDDDDDTRAWSFGMTNDWNV